MANGISKREGKLGSRRIFAPQFKLQVLDSYRADADCKGNQRATARKYGIHRRQIQKWLQAEETLRVAVTANPRSPSPPPQGPVDLSLKRQTSPNPCLNPTGAWDLSKNNNNEKIGYEYEAPTPPMIPLRPVKLFKPYLPEDNFEEVQVPDCGQMVIQYAPASAFERVVPRAVSPPRSSPSPMPCYQRGGGGGGQAGLPQTKLFPRVRHQRRWLSLHQHNGLLMPVLTGIS